MTENYEDFDALKEYKFIKSQVPRFEYNDPEGLSLIKNQTPVILTGSNLVAPAMKWNLSYLAEHIGPGPFGVFCNRSDTHDSHDQLTHQSTTTQTVPGHSGDNDSENLVSSKKAKTSSNKRLNVFKYFDNKKLQSLEDKSTFRQDIVREEINFDEFVKKFNGDRSKERVYLQQPLNNTVGKQIASDFVSFNWVWAIDRQKEWEWGPLTSNLLLIGQKANITPCHYDEQQNLFCQLQGSKRFILFSPDNYPCLYPYPVHHPNDRQSQVDLDDPDFGRFPKFKDVEGIEAIVNPGDILYIPMYWWHHVLNLEDTIAINFWHKAGANPTIEYPLKARQKVAILRNVEKMLLEALQDQDDLKTVLHWLVDARF